MSQLEQAQRWEQETLSGFLLEETPEPTMPEVTRQKPFDEFILKIHSRCNLACDYCYMYELRDQSWQDQPNSVMERTTLATTALRIAEHVTEHDLEKVSIIFHGGEPLLADAVDPQYFEWSTKMFSSVVGEAISNVLKTTKPSLDEAQRIAEAQKGVIFLMQTNGTRITEEVAQKLQACGIRAGISIDGGHAEHDRHRIKRNGDGSYQEVRRGIKIINSGDYARTVFGGLLTVVNLENRPERPDHLLWDLVVHRPPSLDFLFPLGTWEDPPDGLPAERIPYTQIPQKGENIDTPYADYLIKIFDVWYKHGRNGGMPPIRLFGAVINGLVGKPSNAEYLGLDPVGNIVIETDGTIKQIDSLKATYEGADALGLTIFQPNALEAALNHEKTRHRQLGMAALSTVCQSCPLVNVCGGGPYPTRYNHENQFKNPSVYCRDLWKLIEHIRHQLETDGVETILDSLAPNFKRIPKRVGRSSSVRL